MRTLALVACLVLLVACANAGVLLHVQGAESFPNLLTDPGFEQGIAGWRTLSKEFQADGETRHSGKTSIRCENIAADVDSGAFQRITLDQKSPNAIRATAWSKAEGTGSASRGDYSIYLDIQYADGSWVWGQLFNFETGTHDWQQGEVLFHPEKPIKTVNVYFLFRKCIGRVWFDDCVLEEISPSNGQALFDNVMVHKVGVSQAKPISKAQTSDGLTLDLFADGLPSSSKSAGGFFVRDVAAGSDFVGLDNAGVRTVGGLALNGQALGLKLSAQIASHKEYIRFDCEALDTSGHDRAVTIGFAMPMPEGIWKWWHSIRSSEAVSPGMSYCDGVPIEAGAVGQISKYPFACMSNGKESLNLAIPMDEPCVYRIGYNGALRWYTISFDLGFCPEQGVTKQKFSFIIYKSGDGMRAAVDKYYRIFPEYFTKRVEREGNWMAFTKVSGVRDWEDFGFAYHEGDNDVEWDAANGIYSFRYTEPMSHWMAMDKALPRTNVQAFKILDADLRQTNDTAKRFRASATRLCLTEDESGKPRVFFFDTPWCDGAMFVLNCCPNIPPTPDLPMSKANLSWSRGLAEKLYGDKTKPQLAGEYLDSVEMASEYVNTRREHFRYAARPLSFTTRTKRPCILQILSTYEFASWMAEDIHRRGKLMMANAVPSRHGFMAHLFDVLGTETNWLADGKYNPQPDDIMDMRRTLCSQKPFCFLMNTDYEKFDHALVEKYFQRCMFWGMFPSFFSQNASTNCYFDNPKLYDRDRDLFKKYMPVIRQIASAGWQPITMAKASSAAVDVERFGPAKDGSLYFAVRANDKLEGHESLRLDPKLGRVKSAMKLPAGQKLVITASGSIEVTLEPGEVAVVKMRL